MLVEEAEAAASFFPTAGEVVRAVQFVRENPAVVLGVVVGITSLSVAKYYEESEEHRDDGGELLAEAENREGEDEAPPAGQLPHRKSLVKVAQMVSAHDTSMAETVSTETIESSNSGTDADPPGEEIKEICEKMNRNCSFCNQTPPGADACCDPEWGWFIPTSPDEDHTDEQHRAASRAHPAHVHHHP